MPYTDFHYTPTGTGVISGKEVLEQTEDAINDLGGQISGDVQTAIDTANNALNVANTASTDAQNAVNTANTAHTAATNAQNTANAAQTTATNAQTAAQNAQNDVNALGNRVTTAENNITQNTTDISGLTSRMGTAEGNITTLQNDVITAQGTATSAQNTATLARGQAYVVRYASVAVSDNSTVPYTDLNNTDNIKANDLLLDTTGKLYQISSVDTANETVAVTTPLTQLAVDANVMHLSGNETAAGKKIFSEYITSDGSTTGDEYSNNAKTNLWLMSNRDTEEVSGVLFDTYRQNTLQGTGDHILGISIKENAVRYEGCRFSWIWDNNLNGYSFSFRPTLQGANQAVERNLGLSTDKWSKVFGLQYYYGSTAVEFSQKFVTTDTVQDIDKDKNFKGLITTTPNSTLWPETTNTTADITGLGDTAIHLEYKTSGKLTDLSGGAWSVVELGIGCLFFRFNNSTDIRFKHFPTNLVNRIYVVNGANRHINDLIPDQDNTRDVGSNSLRWANFNGLNPGALSLPDLNNALDISGYITNFGAGPVNEYTPVSNGWISIASSADSPVFIRVYNDYGFEQVVYSERNEVGGTSGGTYTRFGSIMIPCIKNVKIYIIVSPSSSVLVSAKFFPCQGNV